MCNKFLLCCASVVCLSVMPYATAFAEYIPATGEGEYRMGNKDTLESAQEGAKANAMRNAVERVCVIVAGRTEVKDLELSSDSVTKYAQAKTKLKDSKVSPDPNDPYLWKAVVEVEVDIDVDAMIAEITNKNNDMDKLKMEQERQKFEQEKLEFERRKFEQEKLEFEKRRQDGLHRVGVNNNGLDQPTPHTDGGNVNNAANTFGRDKFNGHSYAVIDESMDFYAAEGYCQRLGGHLVYIESEAEQKFVENLVLTKGTRNSYWLGAKQNMMGDKWAWLDGTPVAFAKWAKGQPDNRRETALMMYRNNNPLSNNSGLGEWNDILTDGTCNGEAFFGVRNFGLVCEWDY